MSRSLTPIQAMILGTIVLLGLGLIGVAVIVVGGQKWFDRDALHVRVGFPNAQGVEAGTRVRIQGVDVGEVVGVEEPRTTGGPVQLRLRVRGKSRHLVREDASVQIVSVGMLGGKAVEINPGTSGAAAAPDDAELASRATADLSDTLEQVKGELSDTLKEVKTAVKKVTDGDGAIGRLISDPKGYEELLALLQQTKATMNAFQQDAEAFKKLPIIGGYVEDPQRLLVRPNAEKNRKWFTEDELFSPGRAVLTSQGKERLSKMKDWLNGLKHDDSEVVVVAYADPKHARPAEAKTITEQQATTVVAYLRDELGAHKMGVISRRNVIPLGMGVNESPSPDRAPLPTPRIEVLVFVPQK